RATTSAIRSAPRSRSETGARAGCRPPGGTRSSASTGWAAARPATSARARSPCSSRASRSWRGARNPPSAPGARGREGTRERMEEAKRRGTYAIKNRDRAITSEDYESLALSASRRVARAKCVQSSDGSISLLLVPKAERENGDARAIPSRDLIDRVAAYIDK